MAKILYSRDDIIKRDGGKCVGCGANKDLEVHHICFQNSVLDYPEWYDPKFHDTPENMITFCRRCHRGVKHSNHHDRVEEYLRYTRTFEPIIKEEGVILCQKTPVGV